jgi:hypothetical protein
MSVHQSVQDMPPKYAKSGGFRNKLGRLGDRVVAPFRFPSPQSLSSAASQPIVRPSEASSGSNPGHPLNAPSSTRDLGNAAWSGLDRALQGLEGISGVFPPLKSTVGGLLARINIFQVGFQFFLHLA